MQQNGKETIFDRPARKEAFGEINKNTFHNQTKLTARSQDKFVVSSKENPVFGKKKDSRKACLEEEPIESPYRNDEDDFSDMLVLSEPTPVKTIRPKKNKFQVFEDDFAASSRQNSIFETKKICFEEEPIEIGSSYAATCNAACHKDPSVLSAEYAFRHFDVQKEIEKARNLDDFAGEKENMIERVKKGIEEDRVAVNDFLKRLPKEDNFKDLVDDFNDMLVLPDSTPMKTAEVKPKKSTKFQVLEDDDDFPEFPIPKRNKRAFALRRL